MEQFKVGDRVFHADDGDQGDVIRVGEGPYASCYEVDFEQDGLIWVDDNELRLISGNSEEALKNRAEHFEEISTLGEQLGISSFEQSVRRHTDRIAKILVDKNLSYGDSALNPVRIFSKADRMEQLYIRLDDKISRVQKGHEYPGDDTVQDIIGYCVLLLIARETE